MDKYVIYLRKSRSDIEAENRGEMETLARHEKALLELSEKMKLPIEQIYKEVVSGETISDRPVMQKLLSEVGQGIWTGVLVMEIERLARGDTSDQGLVANTFKTGNTKIITPVKTYDPNDEYDEEYFEFGLFMSRREYKTINRRLQRGRIASFKEGKIISSTPPYGYDKIKILNDKGYTFEPNETESKIVKLIYDLYNEGKGMTLIANELDGLKIKPRHRDTWSKSTIRDILQNPIYTGKIRWSYRPEIKTKLDGETIKHRIIGNKPIYADGLHLAIIDTDVFDKAQIMRINNTHQCTKKNISLKNPLSGVIYCKKCGSTMTRLGENKHNSYDVLKCSNRHCDNVSAPLSLIEHKLVNELNIWLSNYEIQINQNTNKITKNQLEIEQSSIQSIKNEIIQIDKQISQTYDLLEREIYTIDIFTKRNKELSERKEQFIEDISDMEKQYKDEISISEIKNIYVPQFKQLLHEYPQIKSIQERNQIIKLIVARIDYLKNDSNHRGHLDNDNFELSISYTVPKLSNLLA